MKLEAVIPQPVVHADPPVERASLPDRVDVLGVEVTPARREQVLAAVIAWAQQRTSAIVDFMGVHGLTTARQHGEFAAALAQFDVVACDGQPIRWALNRWYGANIPERVYGPAMMLQICEEAARRGIGVYLYGGKPDALDQLRQRLLQQFPGLNIAGAESPPFRTLTNEEHAAVDQRVNESGAGLVFIGLGCPKQELFAARHRDGMHAVQLCVGAAFDFHAGTAKMAPAWMQRRGLEWLYRLGCEPRRLWKRYLVGNAHFVGLCLKRALRLPIRPAIENTTRS